MKIKNIERKFFIQLISVIIGIILWAIIIYIEDASFDTTLKGIPVQLSGESSLMLDDLVVVNKGDIGQASISVRGKRSDIINAMDGVSAVADVSNIVSPGVYNIKVSYELATNALYITERKTSSVEVIVENAQSKEFDVNIVQQGTNLDSRMIVESKTDAEKITVKGAAEDIEKIKYMDVFVDISGMAADETADYAIKATDAQHKEIKFENSIYMEFDGVEVENILHKKLTLPVKIDFTAEDKEKYALEVESVSEEEIDVGAASDIDITSLEAVVDYDEGTKNTEYTVRISEKEGVYIPPESRFVTVKIKVRPLTEQFITVPLTIKANEGEAYSAPQNVSLRIRGAAEDISAANITAEADITGYGPGLHPVEVKVAFSKESLSLGEAAYVDIQVR